MSELLDLARFAAVAKTARKSTTLLEDMGIVEARATVTVKDRNKVTKPDEQSLVLVFARRNLILTTVLKGCTHLVVPTQAVEAVTAQLEEMVFDGKFDVEIIAVQELVKETKAKKAAKPILINLDTVAVNDEVTLEEKALLNNTPNVDGLDLSSID